MKLETVRLEVADHIATVTIDRPPVNAQNQKAREELIRVFDAISDRDDVRVVILTAAGKVFSAGADVKERVGIAREPGDYIRNNRLVREYFYAISDCSKPVICAVNGGAFGAGFALMLACDIMLASEDAYFVISELDVGLAGGARFLMDHFGKSMARYIYFTGRRIPAAELHRLGVITACVPRDKLMDEAMADRARDRGEEPGRGARGEARVQRGRGDAGARRLPLRADRDGRALAHRGHQGGAARLHGKAQAGVQGEVNSLTVTLRCEPRLRRASKGDGPARARASGHPGVKRLGPRFRGDERNCFLVRLLHQLAFAA